MNLPALTLMTLMLLAGPVSGLAAVDLRPLAGPTAPLVGAEIQHWQAIWRSTTVEVYLASLPKDAPPDAELVAVLDAAIADKVGAAMPMPRSEALARAKKLLARRGKGDVLATWACFRLTQGDDWRRVNQACNQAIIAFENAPPEQQAFKTRLLAVHLYSYCLDTWARPGNARDQAAAQAMAEKLAVSVYQLIKSGDCTKAPSLLIRMIMGIELNHEDFGEFLVRTVEAGLAAAQVEPWVANAAKAAIRVQNAWAWRGPGFADSITPAGWKGFERNLAQADALLKEAYALHPQEPLLGAIGIMIAAVGHSSVPTEAWLTRSLAAGFDSLPAYENMRCFQRPRWGGSYPDLLGLGCDCVDTARFDTAVPWNLVDCVAYAINDAYDAQEVPALRAALADQRVVQAFLLCLDRYATSKAGGPSTSACLKAAFFWQIGRRQEASDLVKAVPERERDRDIARRLHVSYDEILRFAPEPVPERTATGPDF